MNNAQVVEVKGIRVLTTRQIAEAYGVRDKLILNNFENNKGRYEYGKHYIYLSGKELKEFLHSEDLGMQNQNKIRALYLWTEKGALLHAKSINTDKAWEVYDWLVDFYFRAKEEPGQQTPGIVPVTIKTEPVPEQLESKKYEIPEQGNAIWIFNILQEYARARKMTVRSCDFKSKSTSMLHKDRIGIRSHLQLEEVNYELAYELAHAIIHASAGSILDRAGQREYNERAEKAAEMIIQILDMAEKTKSN